MLLEELGRLWCKKALESETDNLYQVVDKAETQEGVWNPITSALTSS
jgi:hypothetical protein